MRAVPAAVTTTRKVTADTAAAAVITESMAMVRMVTVDAVAITVTVVAITQKIRLVSLK